MSTKIQVDTIVAGGRHRFKVPLLDAYIAHTKSEYFRPLARADGPGLLIARSDLKEALGLAYQSRSKYVHQLKRLPDVVALGHEFGETAVEDRATHLTLQGLARLMRGVIAEFVARQPIVDREPYDYVLESSGVVRVRLAAHYWVGGTKGDIRQVGRDRLEGFLEQLASFLLKERNATITDLRPVLALAAEFVPTLERRHRLPYLALYVAFNSYVVQQEQAPVPPAVAALIGQELAEAVPESLLVHALLDKIAPWPVDVHAQVIEDYLRRRGAKNGVRFPRVFEAALILDLAERYRALGNLDRCRMTVALAVECHPGHLGLLELERGLGAKALDDYEVPIRWRAVLLQPLERDCHSALDPTCPDA